MNILAADDDKISRTLLRRMLEADGRHAVSVASDGEEAWWMLKDTSNRYDAVVLDVMMPRIDGIDLLNRIRNTPGLEKLPVILCTGANDRTTVERAVQLSANHFIVKPFTAAVVHSKLQAIEASLGTSRDIEDISAVCTRLGIDAETHRALVDALLNEIHDWLTATKVVAVSKRFDRMALRANGLKGGCANLGLHALGRLLDAVETMLSAEADSELRSHFVLAEAELAPLLDQVAVCTASIRQLQLSPG